MNKLKVKITSDGTLGGTKIVDESGKELHYTELHIDVQAPDAERGWK